MSSALPIAVAGKTDRGRMREHNEDGYLCDDAARLYAVADGLGGLPKGELASSVALQELDRQVRVLPPETKPDWQDLFSRINRIVLEAGRAVASGQGIGTTLTAVRATPGKLHLGHIGDSGLYLISAGGKIEQVTRDQTMAQELLDKHGPAIAESIPEHYHHTLTQCIGQPIDLVVEQAELAVREGLRVLLYTDGVTKTINPGELAQLIAEAPNPRHVVERIVDLGNARGGPDNITAVALFY